MTQGQLEAQIAAHNAQGLRHGGCCCPKIYGLYLIRKEEGRIIILVRLYVSSYQTLRPWHDYICTWELYVIITNIEMNKE